MAKNKMSPKNLELDVNVAKKGQFLVFRRVKIRVPRNTAGPADLECVEINANRCTQNPKMEISLIIKINNAKRKMSSSWSHN